MPDELTPDELETVWEAPTQEEQFQRPPPQRVTAADLLSMELPPPMWVVPGVLPEGLAILAARPKLGKSWLALGVAVEVTHGHPVFGMFPVEQGEVLYLALEDTLRRLKARYTQMTDGLDQSGAKLFSMQTSSPRINEGLLEDCTQWIEDSHNPRLIIVDTLGKVRPNRGKSDDAYQDSYTDLTLLKNMADEHGICVMVIHHTRKTSADDTLEEVLGSTGFTGAADSILVLKRKRGDQEAVLLVTGRDVEEMSMFLRFDPDRGRWISEETGAYTNAPARDAILEWCLVCEALEFTPEMVAKGTGITRDAARMGLSRLSKTGQVRKVRNGVYRVPTWVEQEGGGTLDPEQEE